MKNARIFGGIDFRTACVDGAASGSSVADFVMTRALLRVYEQRNLKLKRGTPGLPGPQRRRTKQEDFECVRRHAEIAPRRSGSEPTRRPIENGGCRLAFRLHVPRVLRFIARRRMKGITAFLTIRILDVIAGVELLTAGL